MKCYPKYHIEQGRRIRKLREGKSLSRPKLAKLLFQDDEKDHVPMIRKWELGENTPKVDMLIKLSEIFNVSVDYLLCRTDFTNIGNKEISEITGLNNNSIEALRLCNQNSLSGQDSYRISELLDILLNDRKLIDVSEDVQEALKAMKIACSNPSFSVEDINAFINAESTIKLFGHLSLPIHETITHYIRQAADEIQEILTNHIETLFSKFTETQNKDDLIARTVFNSMLDWMARHPNDAKISIETENGESSEL